MSCISEILKVKGDKEFILSGNIAIEGGGSYKGYEYIITFVSRGHRCGYVAISLDDPTYNENHDCYGFPDFDVHGGITYFEGSRFEDLTKGYKCTDKWVGFDAAHAFDSANVETMEKYFGETEYLKSIKENETYNCDGEHRSYGYMQDECKKLIDQLIMRKNENNKI